MFIILGTVQTSSIPEILVLLMAKTLIYSIHSDKSWTVQLSSEFVLRCLPWINSAEIRRSPIQRSNAKCLGSCTLGWIVGSKDYEKNANGLSLEQIYNDSGPAVERRTVPYITDLQHLDTFRHSIWQQARLKSVHLTTDDASLGFKTFLQGVVTR